MHAFQNSKPQGPEEKLKHETKISGRGVSCGRPPAAPAAPPSPPGAPGAPLAKILSAPSFCGLGGG